MPHNALAIQPEEPPEMQVYGDDGRWHRRSLGERYTACGVMIAPGANIRYPDYSGKLCPECFTSFELKRGENEV